MARGSKVFRPADVSESNASSYPEPFREGQRKRYSRRLGAGLAGDSFACVFGRAWI